MPSTANPSLPFSPAELSYLHTSLSSIPPIRLDSRSATDFRPLSAETGILPATNGSAHLSFSDGSEAIVGVKLEVEKTASAAVNAGNATEENGDHMEVDEDTNQKNKIARGQPNWISFGLTLPGLRDDDTNLVFLEEMLREPLITATSASRSLQDKLVINSRWHWHIYIDVLLVSAHGLAGYPLPLLSMATHLALRDTRVPKLKSEGEEDPVANDDWMASIFLYSIDKTGDRPPVTLLVVVVGDNIIFDPSHDELKVADGVIAVSVGSEILTAKSNSNDATTTVYKMLSMRMIDTPARDTMRGVPRSGELQEGVEISGVWKPRVGGVKRDILKKVVKAVLNEGVAEDVMNGLNTFLQVESRGG